MNFYEESLKLHESLHGKLEVNPKKDISSLQDLSLVYTPGVAEASRKIAENKNDLYKYTIKSNSVAVVTNGTAVLGLGNIGAAASLPVMEGKCLLFKKFANIDAFPICVDETDPEKFVEIVKKISVPFGGINLEDIAAPACFEIERKLAGELDIPVFHDDQHGTAIVVLAALINAEKLTGNPIVSSKIVISGAGAAGLSIADLLINYGAKNVIVCDSKGAISKSRTDLNGNSEKNRIAGLTNPENENGTLKDVIKNASYFIGVSKPGLLTREMVGLMGKKAAVFALANPEPEIMPEVAVEAGAYIVGTGRSDFPNQINNALAFPGVFRGALNARVRNITKNMQISAAKALADCVKNPEKSKILPGIFDENIVKTVSEAIEKQE